MNETLINFFNFVLNIRQQQLQSETNRAFDNQKNLTGTIKLSKTILSDKPQRVYYKVSPVSLLLSDISYKPQGFLHCYCISNDLYEHFSTGTIYHDF